MHRTPSFITFATGLLCFLILVLPAPGNAQEFTIKSTELTTDGIVLRFDLIDTTQSRTYTINLYSSRDNFLSPLHQVKGDAGLEVKPGANKKITWSAREELGAAFRGNIELEVRGRVYIPFVRFNDFKDGDIFKRGKPKTLTWTGGTRQNILNFSIYNSKDQYVDVITDVSNSGTRELILPTTLPAGKGYYFLVSDSKNKDQVMKSPVFEVQRKIPLLVKAVPVALVGAAIVLLLPKSGPKDLGPPPDVPSTTN